MTALIFLTLFLRHSLSHNLFKNWNRDLGHFEGSRRLSLDTDAFCPEDDAPTCLATPNECPQECKNSKGDPTPNIHCLKACLPWQKCFGNTFKDGCRKYALGCQSLVQIPIGDDNKIKLAREKCVPGQYSSDDCLEACLPGIRCVFDDISGARENLPCTEWVKACRPAVPLVVPCVACTLGAPADFTCMSSCVPYIHCIGKGCSNAKAKPCEVLAAVPVSTRTTNLQKAKDGCRSDPSRSSCVKACFPGIKCIINSFSDASEANGGLCSEWVSACKGTFPAAPSCPAAEALTYCSSEEQSQCPTGCVDKSGNAKPDLECLKECLSWQKCFGNSFQHGCRENAVKCQSLAMIPVGEQDQLNIAKTACVQGKYDSDACRQSCLPGLKCVFVTLTGSKNADPLCPQWEQACIPAVPPLEPCVACETIPDFSCLSACVSYIHCIEKGCNTEKAAACAAFKTYKVSTSRMRLQRAEKACEENRKGVACIKECLWGIQCVVHKFAGSEVGEDCSGWISACETAFMPTIDLNTPKPAPPTKPKPPPPTQPKPPPPTEPKPTTKKTTDTTTKKTTAPTTTTTTTKKAKKSKMLRLLKAFLALDGWVIALVVVSAVAIIVIIAAISAVVAVKVHKIGQSKDAGEDTENLLDHREV